MVGMRNETIISMRFVRSKLRKREESSHNNTESTQQPNQIVSTVEPAFRQSPSSVWHFPPLPPQPNLYIYNASSQVSTIYYYYDFRRVRKIWIFFSAYQNKLQLTPCEVKGEYWIKNHVGHFKIILISTENKFCHKINTICIMRCSFHNKKGWRFIQLH